MDHGSRHLHRRTPRTDAQQRRELPVGTPGGWLPVRNTALRRTLKKKKVQKQIEVKITHTEEDLCVLTPSG